MKIGEAARASGLSIKTVRYYANIKLVVPKIDERVNYRHYNDQDIAKLRFVGTARRFDFSIGQCRDLLALYEDKERSSKDVKELTLKKIDEIDTRLQELGNLRRELIALANSCDGDERSDCPIIDRMATAPLEIS